MSVWASTQNSCCQMPELSSTGPDPKHHQPLFVAVEVPVAPRGATAAGLFCGDCSLALESSNAFFSHWLALHCQPHSPSNTAADNTNKLVMQRCLKCNHIFVEGTERCTQHTLRGCQSNSQDAVYVQPTSSSPHSNSVSDVIHTRKRKQQEDDCLSPTNNKVSNNHVTNVSVGRSPPTSLGGGGGGAKRCICGLCHAQVKSVTSYFLHWVREHQEATTDTVLQEVWQCKACPTNITRLFPDTHALTAHVGSEHSRTDEEQGPHHFALGAPTQCPLVFTGEDSCNRHFSTCHAASHQVCSVCRHEFPDLCKHFVSLHAIRCQMCSATLDSQLELKAHWENSHKCDLVWSRSSKLQLTDKILGNGTSRQCPARLANGAIAKSANLAVSPLASQQQLSPPPEAVVAAGLPSEPKVLQNVALREKFLPVEGKSGFKCVKCEQQFVNEKLMEKHYFANHEFRCKFCELVMDKDNYGVHLRQHLATERRKNQCY